MLLLAGGSDMKVACVQMDVLHCRKQKNLEKALYMAHEAVRGGAELIVFPELFSTGFCYERFEHAAETLPSPVLENLACFSEANDCIIMGSIIEKVVSGEVSGSRELADSQKPAISSSDNSVLYYNLGFCFESGNIAGTYRKTHPFKGENQNIYTGSSIEPIA